MLETGEIGRRLTRILSKKPWSVDSTYTEISCDSAVQKFGIEGVSQTIAYTTIDQYVSTYQGIKLKGFKVRDEILPDGSEAKQVAILNLVGKGTPLFKALVNKDAIDFRYIVDSFGLGLIADSKQQLVDLAGERLDCFAFINMPSIRQFKNSTNPSFTNDDGTINTAFIAAGGDVVAAGRKCGAPAARVGGNRVGVAILEAATARIGRARVGDSGIGAARVGLCVSRGAGVDGELGIIGGIGRAAGVFGVSSVAAATIGRARRLIGTATRHQHEERNCCQRAANHQLPIHHLVLLQRENSRRRPIPRSSVTCL
jgi:hypothetical protein